MSTERMSHGLRWLAAGLLSVLVACGPEAPKTSAPTAAPAAPTAAAAKPAEAAKPAAPAPTSAPAAAASGATQAAKPAAPAAEKPAAAAPASGGESVADMVAKAKAAGEGEIIVYLGRAGSRQLIDAFKPFEQKYGLKVTPVIGSGNENADKLLAERDTGLYSADLWMGGLTTINTRLIPKQVFEPIEPLIVLPEIKDTAGWYQGKHWFGDGPQKFTFLFSANLSPLFSYNTQLVKDEEFESWLQFLDDKWKGKIVSRNPTSAGTGGNTAFFYFNPKIGPDFLQKLYTQQNVTIMDDARQAAESLALGKFAIYFLPSGNDVTEMSQQGLPVKDFLKPLKEGARISAGGTGSISVFNKAPHPNATKAFLNWWLSKEGQIVAQTADPIDQSLRIDIPTNMLEQAYVRDPKTDYMFMDADPSIVGKEDEMLAFMKKVMAQRP